MASDLDRDGAPDPFDLDRVTRWLGRAGTPTLTRFTGGASHLTYLLRYPDGEELVLRRPPPGAPAAAHDMAREYRVQQLLKPVFPPVPAMRALCRDPEVLGGDFYVMDRVPGRILRGGDRLTPARCRVLSETFVDTLADLHGIDPDRAGLGAIGKGEGYVERQVAGWTRRYRQARTADVPSFDRVTGWLADHCPAGTVTRVVHNDWRLDNIVLDADMAVTGVLDWELATLGDPLMDLGNAMAYWVDAGDDRVAHAYRRQPSQLPGMLTRAEIVRRYLDRTGLQPPDWSFYAVFGLFRLAGIAQQIYHRFRHGHTADPRFRDLGVFVNYLHWRCAELVRR